MKNLWSFLRVSFSDKQNRLSLGLIVLTLAGLLFLSIGQSAPPKTEAPPLSDEMIPEGFVLVPLDLQNRDALNDLVGAFTVVDLFTVSADGRQKGTKVGSRVKLIRTPQNPTQFSALIPEDEAPLLFSNPGPLFAVVQSRRKARQGTTLIGKTARTSRIHVLSDRGGK